METEVGLGRFLGIELPAKYFQPVSRNYTLGIIPIYEVVCFARVPSRRQNDKFIRLQN
jgi:hypothetical protein